MNRSNFKIGSVALKNITVFAPLAGITNLPMRLIAKEAGCALVCTEMISANGLVFGSKKTRQMLESVPEEKPLSVQIFGSDPSIMTEAAKLVESLGADILDINFGCSVKKILKSGSGAALMRTPDLAASIIKSVRQAIVIPLTIKIRTGWDRSGRDALAIAEIAEDNGVDALAVHPRIASQGFGGDADWGIISKIKQMVSIPVIGNGDVVTAQDAVQMLAETDCDAVMIGRAAVGNPWLFSQVDALVKGEDMMEIDLSMRFRIMCRYLSASVAYFGEKQACLMMRSRLGWFVKGLPHASRFRESIKHISSEAGAMRVIDEYKDTLEKILGFPPKIHPN